jgi:hypothetical protein
MSFRKQLMVLLVAALFAPHALLAQKGSEYAPEPKPIHPKSKQLDFLIGSWCESGERETFRRTPKGIELEFENAPNERFPGTEKQRHMVTFYRNEGGGVMMEDPVTGGEMGYRPCGKDCIFRIAGFALRLGWSRVYRCED